MFNDVVNITSCLQLLHADQPSMMTLESGLTLSFIGVINVLASLVLVGNGFSRTKNPEFQTSGIAPMRLWSFCQTVTRLPPPLLETIPEVFKSKFLEICDGLQGFYQIYTDGSKTNNGTAAAAMSGDVVKSLRITSHASIFTAEKKLYGRPLHE